MTDSPLVQSAIEAANDPRIAAAVGGGAIGGGLAAKLELVQGVVGTASICVGFLTGVVVLAIQMIKLVRYWRSIGIEPRD